MTGDCVQLSHAINCQNRSCLYLYLQLLTPEAVVHRYSSKQVLHRKNYTKLTQENTGVGVRPAILLKRDSNMSVFLRNFAKFSRAPFFTEHLGGCSCLQFLIYTNLLILICTYLSVLKGSSTNPSRLKQRTFSATKGGGCSLFR